MLKSTVKRHGRFLLALALGLAMFGADRAFRLSPILGMASQDNVISAVIGVNGFFITYLSLMLRMILITSDEDLRRHAEADDEGATLILLLALSAAVISLSLIFIVLKMPDIQLTTALFALAAAPMGWATLHVLAAFRYAHLYYAPDPDGGLDFPSTTAPGIWDFLYFSFTIGMTAQVSDVEVSSSGLRKTVLLHSIGSFFFNTVILALAVNAAVNLTKPN